MKNSQSFITILGLVNSKCENSGESRKTKNRMNEGVSISVHYHYNITHNFLRKMLNLLRDGDLFLALVR